MKDYDKVTIGGHLEAGDMYLTHPSVASSGAYDQMKWRSRIRDAAKSPQARIVTIHEMLHSELNNSTGFGLILMVLADICKENPERKDFRETLNKLVSRCRTVHEVFATTSSLLLLGEEDDPETLLKYYPNYHRYYRIGLSICNAFKGFTLRYNSLYTVIRVCMHPPIIRNVLEMGLDKFGLSDIRVVDCPDNRFNILRFRLEDGFWWRAVEKARRDCPDPGFWELIDQEEKQGSRSREIAADPRFDILVDDLIRSLYASCTEILKAQGVESLSFNGHQAYTQPLLDSAQTFYPETRTRRHTMQAHGEENREELIIRNLELERLVLQEPCEGQIFRLENIPQEEWALLATGEPGIEHLFICVRPAARLVNQYRFTKEDKQFLESHGNTPMLFFRRSAVEPETRKRIVQFFYVDTPSMLELFLQKCPGQQGTFSSVSLSVYFNGDWEAGWNEILRTNTEQALLMDISPAAVLKFWAAKKRPRVGYELINFRADEDVRSVMAFDFHSGNWPLVLAPCSSVSADALVMYITSGRLPENCFNHNRDIIPRNQFLLSIMLSHLFKEEPWFDFQGTVTEGSGEEMDK